MPKIELIKVIRACDYNDRIVKDGEPTRDLIRDFNVIIDGEHRAILKRDGVGVGYYLTDIDGRRINDLEFPRSQAKVSAQSVFLPFINKMLAAGAVPTLAETAMDRIRDEAHRANNKFDQHISRVANAKIERADDLYALALSIATADTPVLEQKLADRARTLIAEIADQVTYWDGLED